MICYLKNCRKNDHVISEFTTRFILKFQKDTLLRRSFTMKNK